MIDRTDIEDAYARIMSKIVLTPTVEIPVGALCDAAPVSLKLELLQTTGSFKLRGATNALMSQPVPDAGVAAFSGGNHGAALAHAATSLGVPSRVFTPSYVHATKIERMRAFGATVIVSDSPVPQILKEAQAYAKSSGALLVHPYDDPMVVRGQGTVALEIENQFPEIDTLFVSVGGGGLISGITAWFQDRIKIVAVESEGTATYANALIKGSVAEITPSGVAASALGASSIGALPWEILQKFPPVSMVVSDEQIIEAQVRLWKSARIVSEPGAATALAPLTSGAYRPAAGEKVAALICGGNAEPNWFLS